MDFGLAASEDREETSNGGVLCHGSEHFVEILPQSLGESFGTESRLVKSIVFGAEDPVGFDHFRVLWARD
jgi:hypothetical protein